MVPMGLAENDVSDFVEELMARHKEVEERLEHIDSLHELATRTLQDAQELAEEIKEQGRKQTDEYAQSIIPQAKEQARAIIEAAEQQALVLLKDAQKTERDRLELRSGCLGQVNTGDLIVGAQELAERLLTQANTSAGTDPGSAEMTASQLEKWLATTAIDPPINGSPNRSTGSDENESNGASKTGTLPSKRGFPRPTFRWKGVSGATRYALCVFGPPYGMDDIVFLRADIIETSFTLPFYLEERVTYRWTVCGGSATGWGKPYPYLQCNG